MDKNSYLRVKRFFYFLKKNNALKQYIDNLLYFLRDDKEKNIVIQNIVHHLSVCPFSIIDFSFGWRGTKEGYSYWHEIDYNWRIFLSDKNDVVTRKIFF